MANLIIIRGERNSGKTTTAGLAYIELLKLSEIKHLFDDKEVICNNLKYDDISGDLKDFRAALTINNKKVGIISAGDFKDELKKWIDDFIAENFEIIICCSRSRNVKGSSYKMLIDEYSLTNKILKEIWISHSPNKDEKESIKMKSVLEIIEIVTDNLH